MKAFTAGLVIGIFISALIGYGFAKYKGYVLAPVAAISAVYALDKLKTRNAEKKKNFNQMTTKKMGKRIATQTIAAGTVGTVAVLGLVTAYAVDDYCEELKDIHEVDALIKGELTEFDFEFCMQTTKQSTEAWINEAVEYSKEKSESIIDGLKSKFKEFRAGVIKSP